MARCNRRRSPRYGRRTKVNLTHQQICRCLVHNGFGSVALTQPNATGFWWVALRRMRQGFGGSHSAGCDLRTGLVCVTPDNANHDIMWKKHVHGRIRQKRPTKTTHPSDHLSRLLQIPSAFDKRKQLKNLIERKLIHKCGRHDRLGRLYHLVDLFSLKHGRLGLIGVA